VFPSYLLRTLFAVGLVGLLMEVKGERRRYEQIAKGSGVQIPMPALQPLFLYHIFAVVGVTAKVFEL
jgi:hypothetical protein